ncbi:MAG: hypothetical protein Q9219_004174 [cf. Caloplaca sp. 3 TL-2023]
MAINGQRQRGGGRNPWGPPPGLPSGQPTTPPTTPPTILPTVAPNTEQFPQQNTVPEQNTAVNTGPNNGGGGNNPSATAGNGAGSNPTGTAPGPVNTGGGGSTGGGGGGNCAAVQGNMNVEVSGANVAFRIDPPVDGTPTTGNTGDCGVWSFPPGWQGRVHVGGGSGAPDGGTLYEANVDSAGGHGAMDVSFVEGFSVPMMCTDSSNGYKSGCGIDLFTKGTCPTGGSAGGVCKNPQGPGGDRDSANRACEACSPPDPFFGPCAAAAFTFPTDDDANDGISGLEIKCTIGPSDETTGREGDTALTGHAEAGRCSVCSGSTKRDLEKVLFSRKAESPVIARSPSMLPRVHKKLTIDGLGRRSHRHGIIAHDGKAR